MKPADLTIAGDSWAVVWSEARSVRAASVTHTQVYSLYTARRRQFSQRNRGTSQPAYYYLPSAAVAVDSIHITVSSSASWSRFSPPSHFVNGHVSTVWFMVCCWPLQDSSADCRSKNLQAWRLYNLQPTVLQVTKVKFLTNRIADYLLTATHCLLLQ